MFGWAVAFFSVNKSAAFYGQFNLHEDNGLRSEGAH
jgi:hypothetical protein